VESVELIRWGLHAGFIMMTVLLLVMRWWLWLWWCCRWWWCALAYLFTPGRLLLVVWGLGWVWVWLGLGRWNAATANSATR